MPPKPQSRIAKISEVDPAGDTGLGAPGSSTDHAAKAYQRTEQVLSPENRDTSAAAQVNNFQAFLRRAGCKCISKKERQDIHEEVELDTQQAIQDIKTTRERALWEAGKGLLTTGDEREQDKNIKAAVARRERVSQPRRSSRLSQSVTADNP